MPPPGQAPSQSIPDGTGLAPPAHREVLPGGRHAPAQRQLTAPATPGAPHAERGGAEATAEREKRCSPEPPSKYKAQERTPPRERREREAGVPNVSPRGALKSGGPNTAQEGASSHSVASTKSVLQSEGGAESGRPNVEQEGVPPYPVERAEAVRQTCVSSKAPAPRRKRGK